MLIGLTASIQLHLFVTLIQGSSQTGI